MPLSVHALDHLVLNVSDVEVSAAWYGRTLGMVREDTPADQGNPPRTSMKFGVQKINLRPVSTKQSVWFTADRAIAGSDDVCFLTDAAPQAVIAHLGLCGIAVEKGPVEKRGARGTLMSVYCRDPDGNLIEISSYPADFSSLTARHA
jgi:catechol 2,3-dioxygenase-like lactoylglutathione lyase family enzyme